MRTAVIVVSDPERFKAASCCRSARFSRATVRCPAQIKPMVRRDDARRQHGQSSRGTHLRMNRARRAVQILAEDSCLSLGFPTRSETPLGHAVR